MSHAPAGWGAAAAAPCADRTRRKPLRKEKPHIRVLVTGPQGSGKTRVISALLSTLVADHNASEPVYTPVNLGSSSEGSVRTNVFGSVVHIAESNEPLIEYRTNPDEEFYLALRAKGIAGIKRMPKKKPVVRTARAVIRAAYPEQFRRIIELNDGDIKLDEQTKHTGKELLARAFVWSSTSEGTEYWCNLVERGHS